MDFQIAAITAVLLLYGVFFAVGALAGRGRSGDFDELLLANRTLTLPIGVLTMVATWVGGGFLNGTAEAVFDPNRGLLWAQAPWGYALSLVLGGLFFAGRMRRAGYRTLLDPFEHSYGTRVTVLLYIPALLGEIFWSAAILVALGTTFGIILNFDPTVSILISSVVVVGYTMIGGLRSVAYTDALQFLLILGGLGAAVPYVLDQVGGLAGLVREYTSSFGPAARPWPVIALGGGSGDGSRWIWSWIDSALLLIFGGIPWQVYFQRVLACKNEKIAVRLSIAAGFGCLLAAVPAVLLGASGAITDWSTIAAGAPESPAVVLPHVLRYLTPPVVAVIGLATIGAAVMSSVDSSILSASSQFCWNVYRPLAQAASPVCLNRVFRLGILGAGLAATLLALKVQSVYSLWFLCSDLVYVLLFPQLVMVLFSKSANRVGALAGLAVGLFLRLGGGEPSLGIQPFLPYPVVEGDGGTWLPFRTIAMLASLAAIGLVSRIRRKGLADGGRGNNMDSG